MSLIDKIADLASGPIIGGNVLSSLKQNLINFIE